MRSVATGGQQRGSGLPWLDGSVLRSVLPVADAVDALEAALRRPQALSAPQRIVVAGEAGQLLVMPAVAGPAMGVKLLTLAPGNPARGLPLVHGLYVLFDPDTLQPGAVLDGGELTAIRTSAVSALATRHLAREEASRLVVFGAGVQAVAHVTAMRAVREISQVKVVARSDDPADAFVRRLRADGVDATRGRADDVAGTDIVCTCTTADRPVFDGRQLAPGTHVNAIGSYQPHTREIDSETLRRSRVVVEDREAVLAEAGDIQIPLQAGEFAVNEIVTDLAGLVAGTRVRRTGDEITVFKSVGVAWEDLVVAGAALMLAGRLER